MRLRLHAPRGNGEVLAVPGFDEVPALVERNRSFLNRSEVRIGDMPLRELRLLARKELQSPVTAVTGQPLVIGGHQPELSHPGVWVKNFALNGLAKQLGAASLHLVVDSDTPKQSAIKLPTFVEGEPDSVALETLHYDRITGTPTFEDYTISEPQTFASFLPRLRERTANWPFTPLAFEAWPKLETSLPVGEQFTNLRRRYEAAWGCENAEWSVSSLSRTDTFRRFVSHIAKDLARFRESYNGAIRAYRKANRVRSGTHPAPELDPFEAPFWVMTEAGRKRLFILDGEPLPEEIRPRALTLTLFARLILGDFFIHGIGGGKYDEVTDAIIRDYFGMEPPAYQVVSATLHLPLPGFPASDADAEKARRLVRDLTWNPQRCVVPPSSDDRFVLRLVADREDLAASEPPLKERIARREWYRKLADLNEQLRHHVWEQLPPAKANLAQIQAEARANAVLRRRDYSWILYPESILKPFLQRFLNG